MHGCKLYGRHWDWLPCTVTVSASVVQFRTSQLCGRIVTHTSKSINLAQRSWVMMVDDSAIVTLTPPDRSGEV